MRVEIYIEIPLIINSGKITSSATKEKTEAATGG